MRLRHLLAPLALAACGGGDDGTTPPPSGWIEVPGMICADGTTTGIGILPGRLDAVLVYLAGGGACWSDEECLPNTPRAFGRELFDFATDFLVQGTILDRTISENPFAAWTIVAIPYCTGDVHAGDAIEDHLMGGIPTTWNHHGYRNLEAAVARIAAELPLPAQVVVAGSSAGGFGALVAYDLVRAEWPPGLVRGALVDDSAPTFVGDAMPPDVRAAWWDAWNLSSTVTPRCTECQDDLSAIWRGLADRYPDDRLALVSTTQDGTMCGFFGDLPAETFQDALEELSAALGQSQNTRTFVVGGTHAQAHALLFPSPFAPPVSSYAASDGTTLLEWLGDMVDPDPAWTSKEP